MEQVSDKKPKYNYYKTHKDKFNEYTDCECGGRYCKNTRYNHFKSAKHRNAMKIIGEQKKTIEKLTEQINTIQKK